MMFFRTGVNIQDDVHSQMLMDGFWWIRFIVLPQLGKKFKNELPIYPRQLTHSSVESHAMLSLCVHQICLWSKTFVENKYLDIFLLLVCMKVYSVGLGYSRWW